MVEIVIDVCERIVALKGAGPAATASEAIEKNGPTWTPAISRTIPIDGSVPKPDRPPYEEIDPAILYDLAMNRLVAFRQFRAEIDRYDLLIRNNWPQRLQENCPRIGFALLHGSAKEGTVRPRRGILMLPCISTETEWEDYQRSFGRLSRWHPM